ncbi:hypothetical protein BU25DRAFT_457894, partial [Macroventuria anomochaeta]
MPGGRPKKYATASKAAEAKKERNRQQYLRKQIPQPQGPPLIIAYEPILTGDTPRPTPANTGLRISSNNPTPGNNTNHPSHQLAEEHLAWQNPCAVPSA